MSETKIIYRPKGQALEYSAWAINPYRGCGHACRYCYVPQVLHMTRPDFDAGAVPRKDFLRLLDKEAQKLRNPEINRDIDGAELRRIANDERRSWIWRDQAIKEIKRRSLLSDDELWSIESWSLDVFEEDVRPVQPMLSFTTDPYHPGDTQLTRQVLRRLRYWDLGFCILTKGGSRALRDLDLFRPERDAFATTLTSIDADFAAKWEPAAAPPAERIRTLEAFKAAGIFTWVSLEPTLSPEASLAVVERTHDFVDLYKVGKANYLKGLSKSIDWRDYTLRMIEALQRVGVKHYIKKDLQEHLPEGYHNPLRVPQHF